MEQKMFFDIEDTIIYLKVLSSCFLVVLQELDNVLDGVVLELA